MPLPRDFFRRPALEVAPELIGALLVHQPGDRSSRRVGRIVETEAYVGPEDLACHASRGRTRRTEIMFGPAGHAYVFVIYGMYPCFNIVADHEGHPAAVLVRAVEPVEGIARSADGPGRVCLALGITMAHYGVDLIRPRGPLRLERGTVPAPVLVASPRVNVDYAGEWAARPWRFCEEGNRHVSRPRPFRLAPRVKRRS